MASKHIFKVDQQCFPYRGFREGGRCLEMGEGRYLATNRNNSEFEKVGYDVIPVSSNFLSKVTWTCLNPSSQ